MMAAVYSAPAMPHTLPAVAARFPPMHRRSGSAHQPPSVSFGDARRPCVELHKPVWVIDDTESIATVTGEIEVNTSLFPHDAPFAVGLELKSSDASARSEWNHDGPNNRPGSFVQIGQRLSVDDTVYTTVTLSIPHALLPSSQHNRVFTLSCCAFLLSDPRVKTELSVAKFMIVRRAPPVLAPVPTAEPSLPCPTHTQSQSRTWMSGKRIVGGWGKVGK
ncbi:formin-like region domain protein [Ceratobasidium sp. AG-Ba]|nr:formin-like region domain protein [Ceratobasidium sp. AG-Ba]